MYSNIFFMIRMLCGAIIRCRSRVIVALFGVAVGATVLLGMIALYDDIPKQMSREFRSYGANMVLVAAGQGNLQLEDAARAADLLPAADLVGMTPFRSIPVRHNMLPYTALGTDFESVKKTSPYWQIKGNWPAKENEVLAGADLAEYAHLAPGAVLAVDGRNGRQIKFEAELTISGILKTGSVEDGFIIMALPDMEAMTGEKGQADMVEISLSSGEQALKALASAVGEAVPSLEARLVRRMVHSEAMVLGKLTTLIFFVTLAALLLTMICVATTMMAVVMERRGEIALKKALGAQNARIAGEFLLEGVVLGFCGGIMGGVLGVFFAQSISVSVFGRSVAMEWSLVPLVAVVSVAVAVAACLLPVRRALDIEPALILRGE